MQSQGLASSAALGFDAPHGSDNDGVLAERRNRDAPGRLRGRSSPANVLTRRSSQAALVRSPQLSTVEENAWVELDDAVT